MEAYLTMATNSYQQSKAKECERQLQRVDQLEKSINATKTSSSIGGNTVSGPATTLGLVLDGTKIKFLVMSPGMPEESQLYLILSSI